MCRQLIQYRVESPISRTTRRLQSSGMSCYVVWLKVTDVSQETTASIFRIEEPSTPYMETGGSC
jgi:hypothetical protein